MNPDLNSKKYDEILFKAIEGDLSPEELATLQQLLKEDRSAREYYLDFIEVHAGLNHIGGSIEQVDSLQTNNKDFKVDLNIWNQLLNDSQSSPSVEIEMQNEQLESPSIPAKIETVRPSKWFRIYSSLVSAAAILLIMFIAYSNIFPPELYMPAATVSSQVNAEWYRDGQVKINDGSTLYTGPMSLKKGLAEIVLNNGTEIILEGPCEFNLESDRQIYLHSGSIVANIENVADKRFVVRTDSATVVDYGTEFGVNVDHLGNTSAQVFQGTVELRQGSDLLKFDNKLRLEKSQGGRVTKQGEVSSYVNDYAFVRGDQFNSEIQAAKGSAFYKWKAYSYKLRQRDDLLAYYTFENIENGMLSNSAWNTKDKYQGKLMTSLDTGNVSELVEGRWHEKKALNFSSNLGQYVFVDSDEQLNLSSDITLAVWVKFDTLEDGGHILSNRMEDSPINYQLGLNLNSGVEQHSKIQFVRYKVNKSANRKYSSAIPDEKLIGWHFVTVTHDGAKINFYIDAELVDTVNYTYNGPASEGDLVMGTDRTTEEMFDGVIGEVAIFNSVLEETEIEQMYLVGKPE